MNNSFLARQFLCLRVYLWLIIYLRYRKGIKDENFIFKNVFSCLKLSLIRGVISFHFLLGVNVYLVALKINQ